MVWWKYALVGVFAYVLGAALFIAGLNFGVQMMDFTEVSGEGHPYTWILFVVVSFGAFPGAVTALIFFLVYFVVQSISSRIFHRLANPSLVAIGAAMLVAQVLTFLLGYYLVLNAYSHL